MLKSFYPWGKDMVAMAGWTSEPVWISPKIFGSSWVLNPDSPTRSECLLRLLYPSHTLESVMLTTKRIPDDDSCGMPKHFGELTRCEKINLVHIKLVLNSNYPILHSNYNIKIKLTNTICTVYLGAGIAQSV
jgi:hypothetical protein